MLVPIDQYKKGSAVKKASRLKMLPPKPRAVVQPAPRPDIRQSENYKNAVSQADKMAQESKKASSVLGMAQNFGKALPRATADVLIGTPAKFIASAVEAPEVAYKRNYTDRTYKVPGLTPFKSFQSDYGNVADKVIAGEKGMGSAAWELAKIPLAGLETGVGASGIARGLKALAGGNVKNAGAIVSDAFLPTNFSKGLKPLPSRGTARSTSQGSRLAPVDQKGTQAQNILKPFPQKAQQISQDTRVLPLEMTNAKKSSYTDVLPQVEERINSAKSLPTETPAGSKLYPNILRSGEKSLENQGQAGKALKGLMKEEQVAGDLQAGEWKALVKRVTSQLDDAQRSNLTDVLEGKAQPIDKTVEESSTVLRDLLNNVQKTAKDTGLDVGYREDYFPRQYNWDEITKGKRKEEVLQHMVESGQASTKAEAENFLRDFVGKNRERKAGNLEYERLFDIPGYEKDPEKALTMYADSAARRISEATYFGNKDQVSSALINKIAEGGGDYREAQKIFDNIYKGEDKNAFAQFLLGYNAFTKLSLGFFSNLTQSVNTATKAGLLNTVKGAAQALAQGVKAVKGKNYDDLAVLANTLDDHVVMQESGLSNKFIQGAMYFFQKIESFNRRTATYAGANRATELASILKADPKSAFAIRQLESLGIKAEDVVNGKMTQEQLLKAANKMTRITQFKIDSLNLPTAWRTPLGKVLSQFKSFSFMQTKFIRDEIVKEARLGNFAPLARFIVLAPMASYATQSMRNAVNNNEKSEPSFRKFDLYRKAVGDLPSDFVTQMQYANEKKDKWYTTPLRNVKNFSSPFIGPTGGDILEVASSLEQKGKISDQNDMWYSEHPEAQKDPNLDLKRFGVSKIPYVGRMLTNTYLGYGDTVAQEAKKKAIEAIQKQDWKALSEAQEQDPYLRRDRVFSNLMKEAGVDKKDPADKALYEEIMKRKTNPFYKD